MTWNEGAVHKGGWLSKTVSCVLTVALGRVTCLGHSLASVGPRLPKRPNGGRTQQKGASVTVGIQTPTTTAKSKDNT